LTRLRALMPRAHIYLMYGLTECKRVAYLPPELIDSKPASVGIPIPDTEAWIEDESGAVITTPGVAGELVVRGPHVMVGYWNRPAETAQALRPGRHPYERELRTGDLFRQDADGHLYFISRRDDLIKTAGKRVGPHEVENVLYELDAVKEAAVIGIPDETLGSAIKAFVALRKGMMLTEAESDRIVDAIRRQVRQIRRKGVVLGLSGGIDSSVTAALAARSLGPERVVGICMPESDSDPESLALGRLVAERYGIRCIVEDIAPTLSALRCYERRNEAVAQLVLGFTPDWKFKLVLPGPDHHGLNFFSVVARSPDGREVRERLTLDAYLAIVAATNFKQ